MNAKIWHVMYIWLFMYNYLFHQCFRVDIKKKSFELAKASCQSYGDPPGFEVKVIDDYIGKMQWKYNVSFNI